MKKIVFLSIIISAFLPFFAPQIAQAAVLEIAQKYSLKQGERMANDLYALASNISIGGFTERDLTLGGGNIIYSGNTAGDILIIGGNVNLSGASGDDVRILGGGISFGGKVKDDLAMAGGQVRLESNGEVGGDLVAGAGRVVIDGKVKGDVNAIGGEVEIDGEINGSLDISSDKVVIGPRAKIGGDLVYRSPQKALIAKDADINGKIIYKESKDFSTISKQSLRLTLLDFLRLWVILKFFMTLLVALVVVLLFKHLSQETAERAVKTPLWNLLMGFIILVSVPPAIILTFMTVVGIPLGLLTFLVYLFFLSLSVPFAGIALGLWLDKMIAGSHLPEVNWKNATLGVVVYTVIGFVPYLGWFIKLALILVALGAFSHYWYQYIWQNR